MAIPAMTIDSIPLSIRFDQPPPPPALKDQARVQLGSFKIKLEKLKQDWIALESNRKKFEKDLPEVEAKFRATEQAAIAAATDENLLALLVAERRLNLFKSFMANADLRRAEIEKTGDGLFRSLYQIWKPLNAMSFAPSFITGGRFDQKLSGALAEIEKFLKQ